MDDTREAFDRIGKGRGCRPVRETAPSDPFPPLGSSLEAMLDKASIGIVLSSAAGRILYCNDALLRMTGYSRGEVMGMNTALVYGKKEDRERFLFRLRESSSVETMETVLVHRAGRPIRARCSSALVSAGPEETILSMIEDVTDIRRLKGEAKLQEEMLASSVAAIALIDCNGLLAYVNPAGLRLFGFDDPCEVLERKVSSFARSPEEAERILEVARANGFWEGRLSVLKRDGSPFDIMITGRRVQDGDAASSLIISYMDITPLAKAETALGESERRYRAIVESQTDAVCRWLPDSTLTFVNDAYARLFGKDPKQLVGMRWTELIPEGDRERVLLFYRDLACRPRTARCEYAVNAWDGKTRWIDWTDVPLFDEQGRLVEFQSVGRDITDRKLAERALEESERQYRVIFENTLVGIYRSTLEGRYLYVNPAMTRIFGYGSPEEMLREVTDIGRQLYVDPAERAAGMRQLEEADHLVSFEVRLRRRDGGVLWGLINSRAVRDEAGGIRYIEGVLVDITALKQAEEALRASEARFFQAFHSSPAAMTIASIDGGRYINVNDRFLEMTGYGRNELIGRSSTALGLWADPAERDALIERLFREGAVSNAPVRRRRKDGRIIQVLWSATVIQFGGEKALLTTQIDVTELHEAMQNLRESEERFSKAFHANPAPMVISTIDRGVFIDANASIADLLAYPRELLVGASAIDLGIWEDPAVREEIAKTLVRDGRVREHQVRLVTRYGDLRDVLFSAEIIALGDRQCMLSLLHDVTERLKTERQLRAMQHRLASVIDFLPDATFVVDRDGVVTMWNRAIEEMTGVQATEMIGFGDCEYALPFYGEKRPILIDIALGGGDTGQYRSISVMGRRITGEAEVPLLRGRRRHLQGTASAIVGPDGEILGAIESIRDITEQREMEKRLFRAQKLEALGSLAGGIAHDFNNLLTTIVGFTELTRMELRDGEAAANLDQVLKAADRARQLVRQILTFSRQGETGKRPLDLASHLRNSKDMLRAMIPSTVDLQLSVPNGDRSIVLIDRVHVDQIVMNLCSNAEHAMRGRTGILEVKLDPVGLSGIHCKANGKDLPPGRYLRLSVRDTGHGIDPAVLDRIYDPFFTTKPPGEGTGLGLSVVYGLVRDHGGCIEVESIPGRGTVFQVYLPAASMGDAFAEDDREVAAIGGKVRVILVDDDSAVLALGERALSSLGCTVTALPGGAEALGRLRSDPGACDLVITDLMMPAMTGIELAREILKIRGNMPILACTGYGDGVAEADFIRMGFRGLLTKPFTRRELASAVRRALDPREGGCVEIHPRC